MAEVPHHSGDLVAHAGPPHADATGRLRGVDMARDDGRRPRRVCLYLRRVGCRPRASRGGRRRRFAGEVGSSLHADLTARRGADTGGVDDVSGAADADGITACKAPVSVVQEPLARRARSHCIFCKEELQNHLGTSLIRFE